MNDEFYVYAYLDPRKRENFFIEGLPIGFLYKPFYIGKGKNSRYIDHLSEAKSLRENRNPERKYNNRYKLNKINKIIKETGNNPFIVKIIENLTENEALKIEENIISLIGLKNLTN